MAINRLLKVNEISLSTGMLICLLEIFKKGTIGDDNYNKGDVEALRHKGLVMPEGTETIKDCTFQVTTMGTHFIHSIQNTTTAVGTIYAVSVSKTIPVLEFNDTRAFSLHPNLEGAEATAKNKALTGFRRGKDSKYYIIRLDVDYGQLSTDTYDAITGMMVEPLQHSVKKFHHSLLNMAKQTIVKVVNTKVREIIAEATDYVEGE
jgi:hypothetical protein